MTLSPSSDGPQDTSQDFALVATGAQNEQTPTHPRGGLKYGTLVELAGRYSNPKEIIAELTKLHDLPPKSGPPRARERRQTQNRLAPDAVEELTTAYKRGATIAELAAAFSINRSTVLAHLTRQKVERRRGLIRRHIDEAADLYTSGWSLARIGKHMNVDAETVRRALREAGVPIRPRNAWPHRPTPGP